MRTSSKCDLRQLAPSTALRTPTHEGQRAGQVKLFTQQDRKTRDPTLLRIPRPTTQNPQRWELVCRVCTTYHLLHRTRDRRENIVRVRTHQSDGTNDDNENHRQHHRILRDILGFLTDTGFPKNVNHIPPPVGNSRTTSDSGGVRDSGKNSD